MDWKVTYDYIWQVHMREKETNQLTAVQKEFYEDAETFIKKLEAQTDHTSTVARTNIIKILGDIYKLRRRKILVYAAYNRPLPPQTPQSEHALYSKICEIAYGGNAAPEQPAASRRVLEALENIPEVIMPNGSRVGPLAKGQLLEADDEETVNFLLETGACRRV